MVFDTFMGLPLVNLIKCNAINAITYVLRNANRVLPADCSGAVQQLNVIAFQSPVCPW